MNNVITDYFNRLRSVVLNYCSILSVKKGVNYNDLIDVWNESKEAEDPLYISPSLPAVPMSFFQHQSKDTVTKTGSKCVYEYKRGDKKGKLCNGDVTSRSQTNNYCNIHLNYEKRLSTTTKDVVSMNFMVVPKAPRPEPNRTLKITIDMNKYGNHEHQASGFVFNIAEEKVIGKQIEDKVERLTPNDIKLCVQYGFKYDDKAVDNPLPASNVISFIHTGSGQQNNFIGVAPGNDNLGEELEIVEDNTTSHLPLLPK